MTEREIFEAVVEKSAVEQDELLESLCGTDIAMQKRVRALLGAHEKAEGYLSEPAEASSTIAYAQTNVTAGDQIGSFKLLQKLGDGGMGTVWVAEQDKPVKRRVALKLVKAGMDSAEVLRRFEAERQALAMMDHTNIAKVFDAGTNAQGRPYFVMELIKGVPITKYCDEVHASIHDRLDLFIQICSAVQHAHQKGIIHRDIKPSNVLVAMQDGKPIPKVIDFGVAKALHTKLADKTMYTEIGQVVGTLEYMAPEQAELSAMDIDTRADIYALGILLYELLTGSTPITRQRMKSAAFVEILRIIKEEEPPKPSTRLSESKESMASLASLRRTNPKYLSSELRGELDWVVLKALEKDRTRRYETANGLSRDLQRYLANETVEARPPSARYRFKKFVNRNKGQVIAASLVLFALLAGIAGTTWGLLEARNEAAAKELARAEEARQRGIAEAEKKRAIEFRDKALDALRSTTGTDVELLLGEKKNLTTNEITYLEAIVKRWQAFAKQEGTDEQSRAIRAEGHFRVAELWSKLGRQDEAQPEYEQAVTIQEKLTADFPTVPEYRSDLATSHNRLGILLRDLRKRALAEEHCRNGLAIREKLVAEFPGVPAYRRDLASSHNSVGNLLREIGKSVEAEKQCRQGLAIREKLAVDFPAVSEYRHELAKSYGNIGMLLDEMGNWAEAEEQFSKGLTLQEKLATDLPTVAVYRSDLGNFHNLLGLLLKEMGNLVEAERHHLKAQALQGKLAADFPAVPKYRRDLALTQSNLGLLLLGMNKLAEAKEQYRLALGIQEKLVADFPTAPVYRSDLAVSHNNLGFVLLNGGKPAEAKEQFRKSIAIKEKLTTDFPSVLLYQIELGASYAGYGMVLRNGDKAVESPEWFGKAIATLSSVHEKEPRNAKATEFLRTSYFNRARANDQLHRYEDAIKDWGQVIALSPPAKQSMDRASRAISQLNAGMVAEAVAELVELTKSSNWNAVQWYGFACIYSVASGKIADKKAEFATRAVELLQRALKAGYQDVAQMKKDTNLDPLRERQDFKKLVAELEAKMKK